MMEELSDKEKNDLRELSKPVKPSEDLKFRIVSQLKGQGQLRSNRPYRLVQMAAAISLLIIGFMAGRFMQPSPATDINPNQAYMLLLHENQSFQPGPPEEMFEEYSNWLEKIEAKGIPVDGQELVPQAISVSGSNVSNLPENAEDRITGYFMIQAESEEEALKIAKDNPHLKYGGTIEIKKFMIR